MPHNPKYRVILFRKVAIGHEANETLVGGPGARILVCLAVHAAVTGEWELTRTRLGRAVYQDWEGVYYDEIKNKLRVAITRLREVINGGYNTLPYTTESKKFGFNTDLVSVDAVDFTLAFSAAAKATTCEDKMAFLLTAVQVSTGEIQSCEMLDDRFLHEYDMLKKNQCDARWQLAQCYEKLGDLEQAHAYANEALAIDRNSQAAKEIRDRLMLSLPVLPTEIHTEHNTVPVPASPHSHNRHRGSLNPTSLTPFFGREDEVRNLSELLSSHAKGLQDNHAPQINSPLKPNEREEYDCSVAQVRQVLSAEAFTVAWEAGAAMSLSEVFDYAQALSMEGRDTTPGNLSQEMIHSVPVPTSLQETDMLPAELHEQLPSLSSSRKLPLAPTLFIGRSNEIHEIKKLLEIERLVTLTGPGGIGKSCLALHAAHDVETTYRDGVRLVELSSLSDPGEVLQAIASAVGLRTTTLCTADSLTEYLNEVQTLLILDNCEHLISACAELAGTILKMCEGVKILATSRVRMEIDDEHTFSIPPMSLPDTNTLISVSAIEHFEAPALFCSRARATGAKFSLTDSSAHDIISICRKLDGVPLALELAAGWLTTLNFQQLREQFDVCLDLLNQGTTGKIERQRTLDAVISGSYQLLLPKEKILFQRLAIFRGGWTLEAITEVCAGDNIKKSEIILLLDRLVNASLVMARNHDEGSRFHMLDIIQKYAHDRLRESNEYDHVRSCHLNFFVELVSEANINLRGAEQAKHFDMLDEEYPNIRAALECCFGSLKVSEQPFFGRTVVDFEAIVKLVSKLGRFFATREHIERVRDLYETLISVKETQVPKEEWATILHETGGFARMQGDYDTACSRYREGKCIRILLNDQKGIASSLYCLGLTHYDQGQYDKSLSYFEEALDINQSLGLYRRIALCLLSLGDIAWHLGNDEEAVSKLSQAHTIMLELTDAMGIAGLHYSRGNFANARGHYEEAYNDYLAALAIRWRVKDRPRIAEVLEGFGMLAIAHEVPHSAAHLYAVADALRDTTGIPPPLKDRQRIEKDKTFLFEKLGHEEITKIRVAVSSHHGLYQILDRCCITLRSKSPSVWDDAMRLIKNSSGVMTELYSD